MSETAAASAIEQANRFASMFKYTQKSYWGGPWYPYWSLILVTICGGFFGLDHFWLRSPTTGILKIIVNIFGLGIWYIYDMLQIIGEQDNVMQYGLSAPIIGPLGIGAGMFVDNQPNVPTSKSPLRFLAYLALVCLPFGFDFFIAGDSNGGMMRFLTSLFFFLWPIGFIWGCFNMAKIALNPISVLEEGTTRIFPFSWFMDPHGPSKLGPKDIVIDSDTSGGGFFNVLSGYFNVIMGLLPTVVQTAIRVAFPAVNPAVEAAATAVQAGATAATAAAGTVKVAANAATGIIQAAKGPAIATVGIASGLAQQLPTVAGAVPGIAAAVGSQLQQQATAELSKAATSAVGKTMVGGGGFVEDAGNSLASNALFVLLVAVFAGGAYMGFKRLNGALPFLKGKNGGSGNGQERNDTPPKPSGL